MTANCTIGTLCRIAAANTTGIANATGTLLTVTPRGNSSVNSSAEPNGTKLPSLYFNYPEVDPEFAKILSIADAVTKWVALLAIILTLIGNLAVILVIFKQGKLPIYKLLILHLAVTDIVYAAFQIFWVHRRFNEHRWVFGDPLCKCSIMMSSSITCSMFMITFIAVERYRTIMKPFLPKLSRLFVNCVVAGLWMLAIAVHIPFATKRGVQREYGNTDCEDVWKQSELRDRAYYSLVVFLITFPLPLIVLAFCYYRIVSRVLGRFAAADRDESIRITTGSSMRGHSGNNNNNNSSDAKAVRHHKLIVMLSLILVAFIVTTTPNQVLIMWMNFGSKSGVSQYSLQRTFVILHILSSLVHLHSCMNPLIYCLSDKRHRRNLYDILCSCYAVDGPPSTTSNDSAAMKSRFQLSPNQNRDTTTSPLLQVTDKSSYQLAFTDLEDSEPRSSSSSQPQKSDEVPETSM